MNVYFVNPTYVKPEGWKPLLNYLKVKAAYSFIPKEELPESLYTIIKPYLKASYSSQDMEKFSNNCVFWLRAHFEKHIRLISSEYDDVDSVPQGERLKYSSQSALNNLKNLDEDNCLILIKLESYYNAEGTVKEPVFYINGLQDRNLPTHITRYCINILHKKYGHNQYQDQSAFIVFNEYFTEAYKFSPRFQEWISYIIHPANGGRGYNFIKAVNRGVMNLAPNNFPLIEEDGKKRFTLLRTEEGDEKLKTLIKDAKEAERKYEEEQRRYDYNDSPSWQDETDEQNRAFWRECGDAGSNCESWPGWD